MAIRGGGHSVAGFSSTDDGIVLDMRCMRGIRVDPHGKTVRAQAGLNWGELDREAQAFGLAVTGGRVTTTGVVGFTLGTGSGWLERKLGFAADNVLAADVVTADGDLVHASEQENEELLWGSGRRRQLRRRHRARAQAEPARSDRYGGLLAVAPEKGGELLRLWRDLSHTNDDIGWMVASVTAPPEPFVPEQWHGRRIVAVAGMVAGLHDEAEKILAPIRALGPLFDLWQPMPYTAMQGLIDGANPYGRRRLLARTQPRRPRRRRRRCVPRGGSDLPVTVHRRHPHERRRRGRARRRGQNGSQRAQGAVQRAPERYMGEYRPRAARTSPG